ncbi:hypothetical protein AVJ23_07945 [Pseudoponticoccus marisrubri]|uniref:HTH merR-type domain-containing protein n=1 Tax=Pseudoponticoccus marisrubri TaxID=1685382 RepID=A0A0W7WM79_9RHOB|nr:hypothetical protein AVJ23_07945 [Pseudoponticoccus marisrubri]
MRSGVRTKKACEIARVDPARFNEMVHAGHYPCAPQTRPGSARIFDLDQTVALKIFGNLLSMSVAPERAGQIACTAYQMFEGQQNVERLVYSCDWSSEWFLEEEGPFPQLRMSRALSLVLDISELREQVGDALKWEEQFGKGEDYAAS